MRSKRKFAEGFILITFIVLSLHWFLVSPLDAMSPGGTLPGFQIPMPDSPEIKAYLGVKGAPTFSLSQVPAKLLVVEFFDVFCLVCQKDAPILNRLYKFIQEDQDLSKNIKMVGFALEATRRIWRYSGGNIKWNFRFSPIPRSWSRPPQKSPRFP